MDFRLVVSGAKHSCDRCHSIFREQSRSKRLKCSGVPGCCKYVDFAAVGPLHNAIAYCKSFKTKTYKKTSSVGEEDGGTMQSCIRVQAVLERSLELPEKSCVAGDDFDPCQDVVRGGGAESSQLSFVPRTPLFYPVGSVSESLGLPNWFRVDCFNNRLASMVTFFDFRAAASSKDLSLKEKELITLDAGLSRRPTAFRRPIVCCHYIRMVFLVDHTTIRCRLRSPSGRHGHRGLWAHLELARALAGQSVRWRFYRVNERSRS